MSRVWWFGKRQHDEDEFAGEEEFVSVFESERMGLERLALLLTANTEVANRCLRLALRECIANSTVSKGWILSWARRVVIRNAVNLLMRGGGERLIETIGNWEQGLIGFSAEDSPEPIANYEPILDLPEFDRLVFVICVLERYSMHDCSLLLGRSPRDVSEACQRTAYHVERVA